ILRCHWRFAKSVVRGRAPRVAPRAAGQNGALRGCQDSAWVQGYGDDDGRKRRKMSAQSAKLTMAFSNVGHFFTHFLMLIYATVVLALDGTFALSYGELLSLSLP